jgi:hypothetical protein
MLFTDNRINARSAVQFKFFGNPNVRNDPCTLYGTRCSVIESFGAMNRKQKILGFIAIASFFSSVQCARSSDKNESNPLLKFRGSARSTTKKWPAR